MGYSTRQLTKLLRKLGYLEDRGRGKGSHIRLYLEHGGRQLRATFLPGSDEEIREGVFAEVLRQTSLTRTDLDEIKAKRFGKEEYLRRLGL